MIDFSRRTILKVTASAAALPAMPYVARADTYPSRSVLMLVGYAPGGPTDICARLIAQWLSQRLGQQFVVENRDGAGSNIATEAAIHAPPDGYTLLLATQSNAINATLYRHLTFDYMASTVPIAGIMQAPSVLEVTPSVPIKSTEEFIAYAKANPGKLDLGTAGNGSPPHMFAELFMYMTGVKLNVIGYRGGGPALVDLLSGQVQVMFEGITSSIGYLRANKLRPLGVTSAKRSPVLPDVPPIADVVKGYNAAGWFGLAAPKGTPQPVIDTLNKAVAAAMVDPTMKAKMANLGAEPMPMGPDELNKLMVSETETWGKVIRAANIHLD
ncbi:MAG: tripartite tricarboxylate transporter substrate binding protein [Xanthobacteraceae bacterium]